MRRSKQFLDLTGNGPMIVETVRRLLPLVPRENIWVVAGEKDAPNLKSRTLGIPPGNIFFGGKAASRNRITAEHGEEIR